MTDRTLRDRVGAYLADHPKATDGFVAAALGVRVRQVKRARRLLAGERLKKLRHERITVAEYNARRAASLEARNARVCRLLSERGELQAGAVGEALGWHRAYARNLLVALEQRGDITSHAVGGHGKPRRFYRITSSQERAA